MIEIFKNIKAKIGITLSSLLSALGISGGSASAVCQTTCSTSSSVLPILGISLSATPFAFIEQYQLYIWWFAAIFLTILFLAYRSGRLHSKADKSLLVINSGLLLMGLPYFRENFALILVWGGLGVVILGLWLLITSKKIVFRFRD